MLCSYLCMIKVGNIKNGKHRNIFVISFCNKLNIEALKYWFGIL